MTKIFSRWVGLLACLVAALFFVSSAAAAERVLGIVAGSGTGYAPYYIGKQKGFYLDEGIDLLTTYVRGTLLLPAVASGGADYILSIAAEAIVGGVKAGTPLKVVIGVTHSPDWGLYVHPSIKTVQDLKGKVIQTGSIGGTQHRIAQIALKQLGVNPDRDVIFIAGGPSAQRLLALKSGAAQGAILGSPANFTAERMGFQKIADLGEVLPLPVNAIITTESRVKAKRDQVKKMIRATLKGSRYVLTHRDETVDWIMKSQNISRESSEREYDSFTRRVTRDGLYTERQLRLILQVYGESAELTPQQIADFSILREVLKEFPENR